MDIYRYIKVKAPETTFYLTVNLNDTLSTLKHQIGHVLHVNPTRISLYKYDESNNEQLLNNSFIVDNDAAYKTYKLEIQ